MYLAGVPVHDQSAVEPFQLGVSVTVRSVVPTAALAATTMMPWSRTVPAAMYLVEPMAIRFDPIPPQLLDNWHAYVTAVRAPEAPNNNSVTRDRMV